MTLTTDHSIRLIHKPNMVAEARARMLSQFRGKPRAVATVRGLASAAQDLEDLAFDIHVGTTLDNAEGDSLDAWGDLVGELRGALADDDYRVFIEARILANMSQRTVDELITIWQLVTAPYTCARYRLLKPAGAWLQVVRSEFMGDARARRVRRIMDDAAGASKTLVLTEGVVDALGFADEAGTNAPCLDGFDGGLFTRAL